jgi:hypothetical protein
MTEHQASVRSEALEQAIKMVIERIKTNLWHNDESGDWFIEIDGQRHDHVTGEIWKPLSSVH